MRRHLAVAACLALACRGAEPPSDPALDSAARFVEDFYAWYLPAAQRGAGLQIAMRDSSALFAAALVRALEEDADAQARTPDEIVGLDGDPFLDAQEFCDAYAVGRASRQGDTVLVEVRGDCPARTDTLPDVVAELRPRPLRLGLRQLPLSPSLVGPAERPRGTPPRPGGAALSHVRRPLALHLAPVMLAMLAGAARAQAPAVRDSLLRCARDRAAASGFQPVPRQREGRLALMRPNESPGPTQLLDALGISVLPGDSAGGPRLNVRVTTFLITRSSGLAQDEVTPRPSLVALADSLQSECRLAPGTDPPE